MGQPLISPTISKCQDPKLQEKVVMINSKMQKMCKSEVEKKNAKLNNERKYVKLKYKKM